MRVLSCLATEHNPWLLLLATTICISGSWVALDLIRRARDRDSLQKAGWIFLAAVAGGASIWCTHFVAMLAYEPHAPVSFEPILTLDLASRRDCWLRNRHNDGFVVKR